MAGVLTLRATDIGDSCQDAYSRETILVRSRRRKLTDVRDRHSAV